MHQRTSSESGDAQAGGRRPGRGFSGRCVPSQPIRTEYPPHRRCTTSYGGTLTLDESTAGHDTRRARCTRRAPNHTTRIAAVRHSCARARHGSSAAARASAGAPAPPPTRATRRATGPPAATTHVAQQGAGRRSARRRARPARRTSGGRPAAASGRRRRARRAARPPPRRPRAVGSQRERQHDGKLSVAQNAHLGAALRRRLALLRVQGDAPVPGARAHDRRRRAP